MTTSLVVPGYRATANQSLQVTLRHLTGRATMTECEKES